MNFNVNHLNHTLSVGLRTTMQLTTEISLEEALPEGSNNDKHYPGNSGSLNYLFIPLAVLITVMLLSIMVYLMARKKHKIFSKHSHVPSFTFDSSDLEDDNDDMETEHLLKGKLRLDEPYFKGVNNNTFAGSNELYA